MCRDVYLGGRQLVKMPPACRCRMKRQGSAAPSILNIFMCALQVVVRVRPPLERELRALRPYAPATAADPSGRVITLSENLRAAANNGVEDGVVYNTYRFAFDRVYSPETPQQTIYEESARAAVGNVLQGYNASIIAFGQTGAGKTHTMTGELTGNGRGIIPRAVDDVFTHIQRDTGERCKFLVRASYLQIYNEVISDLLKPESTNLNIREDRRRGVHVDGLSEWVVRTPADVYALMERGAAARATGATKLNELSSRSHAIFILIVEKSSLEVPEGGTVPAEALAAAVGSNGPGLGPADAMAAAAVGAAAGGLRQTVRVGKLNLVDLAGSERVHLTGAKGKRLEESKKINQSLSALGNVIAALTDPKGRNGRPHIPYRDSKLTRILEDSLGGNCKTTFMAMVSPATEAFAESLSTLKFAHRAKRVRNAPRVNEDVDHRTLLRKYERELRRLRAELQQRSKDLVDKRLLLQLEEARRREQADKIAAITALERQSAEIARQKAAMAALQGRIASMQSQLLVGGQGLEHTPAFRTLLEREQARIRDEYNSRLAELEGERRSLAEDRAAAERVKALLMKQRDVMLALTQRLSERDKEVLSLRTKLEAAEARAKEAEDVVDTKTAELIAVRKSVAVVGRGEGSMGSEVPAWTIPASPPGAKAQIRAPTPVRLPSLTGPEEVEAADLATNSSRASESSHEGEKEAEVLASQLVVPVTESNADALITGVERDCLRDLLQERMLKAVEKLNSAVQEQGPEAAAQDPKVIETLNFLRKLVSNTIAAIQPLPM